MGRIDATGFPSPAWRARLAEHLAGLPAAGGPRLALGQVVTGSPEGEVAWTVLLGGGEPAAVLEGVEQARVCLVGDEEALRGLLEGASPASLLAEGRLKLRGDANALIEAQEALVGLGEALKASAAPGR